MLSHDEDVVTSPSQQPMLTIVPPQLYDIDCEDDASAGTFIDDAELQETQGKVKALVELNVEISTLAKALAERRKQQKVLHTGVMGYMHTNKIPHFDMGEKGKLHLVTSNRKQPLSAKFIAGQLKVVAGLDEEMQMLIIEALDKRPLKQVTKLSHKTGAA
jgi:hypothetical protein